LGLSNLSVPKKLMKAKPDSQLRNAQPYVVSHPPLAIANISRNRTKPKEPPPPFPPPPAFIPINASRIDNQVIGLLRPYYKDRLDALAGSAVSKPPGMEPAEPLPMVLQDDAPNPAQTKMSPLGQIAGGKAAAAVGAAKKKPKREKDKEATAVPPAATVPVDSTLPTDATGAALKKRGGPGRGKKGKMVDPPPRIVVASA
jgi:transcriptional activator SPT7